MNQIQSVQHTDIQDVPRKMAYRKRTIGKRNTNKSTPDGYLYIRVNNSSQYQIRYNGVRYRFRKDPPTTSLAKLRSKLQMVLNQEALY